MLTLLRPAVLSLFLILTTHFPLAAAPLCVDTFTPTLMARMATQPNFPKFERVNPEAFAEFTAARFYMEFARQKLLLQQSAPELNSRGLLEPNGGLCASTCITNVIGAMTTQAQNFRRFKSVAPGILHQVVDAYKNQTGLDARMGAYMGQISESTLSIMMNLLHRLQYDPMQGELNITLTPSSNPFQSSRLSQSMRGDSVSIVSVKAANPQEARTHDTHAIVVLKIDHAAKKIYISDPNLPNEVVAVDFFFTHGSNISFHVPFTYGKHAVEPFEYHTFRRTIFRE